MQSGGRWFKTGFAHHNHLQQNARGERLSDLFDLGHLVHLNDSNRLKRFRIVRKNSLGCAFRTINFSRLA